MNSNKTDQSVSISTAFTAVKPIYLVYIKRNSRDYIERCRIAMLTESTFMAVEEHPRLLHHVLFVFVSGKEVSHMADIIQWRNFSNNVVIV